MKSSSFICFPPLRLHLSCCAEQHTFLGFFRVGILAERFFFIVGCARDETGFLFSRVYPTGLSSGQSGQPGLFQSSSGMKRARE